jgi:hypothetical protein
VTDTPPRNHWGSAAKVLAVQVLTLFALFALQQAFTP